LLFSQSGNTSTAQGHTRLRQITLPRSMRAETKGKNASERSQSLLASVWKFELEREITGQLARRSTTG
jgi:hypothetical protein